MGLVSANDADGDDDEDDGDGDDDEDDYEDDEDDSGSDDEKTYQHETAAEQRPQRQHEPQGRAELALRLPGGT